MSRIPRNRPPIDLVALGFWLTYAAAIVTVILRVFVWGGI